MNTQVNIRLSDKLLSKATNYADSHGFSNVQDLIKETLREKVFAEEHLSEEEFSLVSKLVDASEKDNLYGTEEQLFKKLKRK